MGGVAFGTARAWGAGAVWAAEKSSLRLACGAHGPGQLGSLMIWIEWLREVWSNIHAGQLPDLGVWSYVLLTVLVATEGPLSTLLGAVAAAAGILDVRLVFLATLTGNVAGDVLWYAVGYTGKVESLLHRSPWLGSKRRHLERLKREMHAHAAKLLIFAKLAYGLIVPTLVAAGMARVPWRRWFPTVFVMETCWSLLLIWAGFHAAGWIRRFEEGLSVGGALILAVGVGFWWLRRRIDRKELEMDPLAQPMVYPAPDDPALDAGAERADAGWQRLFDVDGGEPHRSVAARAHKRPDAMTRETIGERS